MGASIMDGQLGRRFFLHPQLTFQRRYEALRAVIAEDRPVTEVAARFGYKPAALSVMISRFNSQLRRGSIPPFFLQTAADARRGGAAVKI
jgi:predicted Zn-dependent protease